MRRRTLCFLVFLFAFVAYSLYSVSTLLRLFAENGSLDALLPEEIYATDFNASGDAAQLIPKIIHQTFRNEIIPTQWLSAQQSCKQLHPDFEYILWTDEKARNFIQKYYKWFLPTFDGYKHPIQRADALRYFVLVKYGGIYIDLDDGCIRRLDPLLPHSAILRLTTPSGVSNDVMGAVPRHPFFLRVVQQLQNYDRTWLTPYITIMSSTGPLFLSVVWKSWLVENGRYEPRGRFLRPRVLMPEDYAGRTSSFFENHVGNSWHLKDASFIFWMERHWVWTLTAEILLLFLSLSIVWTIYCCIISAIVSLSSSKKMQQAKRTVSLAAFLKRTRRKRASLREFHTA